VRNLSQQRLEEIQVRKSALTNTIESLKKPLKPLEKELKELKEEEAQLKKN
jgi:prefoldin subunit 5